MNLEHLKQTMLVLDLETSAFWASGQEVNLQTNFEEYLELAEIKWFGAYSYREKKEYYLEYSKNKDKIIQILNSHDVFIGFNNEEFDYPILVNNNTVAQEKRITHVDCMKILGSSVFLDKKGFKYKGKGTLMGYKFKNNSLENMALAMDLEFQKGKIDYRIFQKDNWTEEEKTEIIKYLKNDIMATKCLFDKLWEYWMPFTTMLSEKDINNLSWIRSSIASLIYKCVCHELGTEATYSKNPKITEEMGGNVFEPVYEEVFGGWIIDVVSLYPHIMCMFNVFAETSPDNVIAWHGNNLFKTKGYYDISYEHPLAKLVKEKLKLRAKLRKENPDDPMVYTLKIFLNGMYGIVRSALFEKVHTENAGWDVCYIGQQIQELISKMMKEFGFETVAGDTDSVMLLATKPEYDNKEYLQKCLNKIIKKIFENAPFPADTFDIKIEKRAEYILFPFSEEPILDEVTGKNLKKGNRLIKVRKGKKKNYLYIYEKNGKLEIEIVGLPLKKDNATPLGFKVYEEVLKPEILKNKRAKFTKEFIDNKIEEYLKNPDIMSLLAVEYKVKPFHTYKIPKGKKEPSGIHAQISKGYFNGNEGVIHLIKNNKVGKAGKGDLYCSVFEALENKLTVKDLELEKLYNEMNPFILHEENKNDN